MSSARGLPSEVDGTAGDSGLLASVAELPLQLANASQKSLERDSPADISFPTADIPTQCTEETSCEASPKRDFSIGSPDASADGADETVISIANDAIPPQPQVDAKVCGEDTSETAQGSVLGSFNTKESSSFSQELGTCERALSGTSPSVAGVSPSSVGSLQPSFERSKESQAPQPSSLKPGLLTVPLSKAPEYGSTAASTLFGKASSGPSPLDALPSPASLLASRSVGSVALSLGPAVIPSQSPVKAAGFTAAGSSEGLENKCPPGLLLSGAVEASCLTGDALTGAMQSALPPPQTTAENQLPSAGIQTWQLQQQLCRYLSDTSGESSRDSQEVQLLLQLLLCQQKQPLASPSPGPAQGRQLEASVLPGRLETRTLQHDLSPSNQLFQDSFQRQSAKQTLEQPPQRQLAMQTPQQAAFPTKADAFLAAPQLPQLSPPLVLDAQLQQRLHLQYLASQAELKGVQALLQQKGILSDADLQLLQQQTVGESASAEAQNVHREMQRALLQRQLQAPLVQSESMQTQQPLFLLPQLEQPSLQDSGILSAPLIFSPGPSGGGRAESEGGLGELPGCKMSLPPPPPAAPSGQDTLTTLLLTLPLNLPFGRIVKFGTPSPATSSTAATAGRRGGAGSAHSLGVKKSYYYFSPTQNSSAHLFFSHAGGICDTFAASLQMELAILSVPSRLVSCVAAVFNRLRRDHGFSLEEPLKLRCAGLQERPAPARYGGRVLTVGCSVEGEAEKAKCEQLRSFVNRFEDAVETLLRSYTKVMQQQQAGVGSRGRTNGSSGRRRGQAAGASFGRRHNIWRYSLGDSLPTATFGEVTGFGGSGCLDLTIRAFDTRPLDRPMKDFSSCVVQGVCCSEIRLVTTKAIEGLTTEIDPRFHPQSIGTRPIVLEKEGALCRHVFAPQRLPKVWAVSLGTSNSASREQQKKTVEACVVAHIENKSKAERERLLETLEEMRVFVEEDGVALNGTTQPKPPNGQELTSQQSKQSNSEPLSTATTEKPLANTSALLEAAMMQQNLAALTQVPQTDPSQQLSVRLGMPDVQPSQRLELLLPDQLARIYEQQQQQLQQQQSSSRQGKCKSSKKNNLVRAPLMSSDTLQQQPQATDALLSPATLHSLEATLQACTLGVDPLAQQATSVRQALQQNPAYPCTQLSVGALQLQQLPQQLLCNVSPLVQEGSSGGTGLKQQPVGIERALGNSAEDLAASCILGRGVASAAALESISALTLPQAPTAADTWPLQDRRTGLAALQKPRDFSVGDQQDVQQQMLEQQQRLLQQASLPPRLAMQVQQPQDAFLSPQQQQALLIQHQQQKPQQDSLLLSPLQQRQTLCFSSPFHPQPQRQTSEVNGQTIGNWSSQMAQQQLQLQQLQLQQFQQLQIQQLQQLFPNQRVQMPFH